MTSAIGDVKEAKAFLDANPNVQFFEIIYTGLSGVPRGKRLRRHELIPLYEQGRFLPTSMLVTDITGRDCEETGFIWEEGDADRIGRPVPGRLTLAPWLGPELAQVEVSIYEQDGTPNFLDPRHVLQGVIDRFKADGLTPVVACELEFYLVDPNYVGGDLKVAQFPLNSRRPSQHDQYSLTEMEEAAPFLRDLWAAADACGIPLEGAISEYGPGQLELTLKHHADAMRSADDAILYKRACKGVALKHGFEATFMAKPFADYPGSGMHMHVSVNDAAGKNVFASEALEGSPLLKHAVGGMKALIGDSMAVFAPNANSFRRFRANSYAPTATAWGVNNRTVSFRVPAGAPHTRHIEHRVAGADAHPALAVAALLAAVHHGISNKIDPGPPIVGDGYAQAGGETGAKLPTNWFAATDRFAESALLKDYFGERFVNMYAAVKRIEQDRYQGVIPSTDLDWYLRAT